MVRQMASALLHLQSIKIIHGDIGLRNFLCEISSYQIKVALTDFGLAVKHPCSHPRGKKQNVAIRWLSTQFITDGIPTFEADMWLWESRGGSYFLMGKDHMIISQKRK